MKKMKRNPKKPNKIPDSKSGFWFLPGAGTAVFSYVVVVIAVFAFSAFLFVRRPSNYGARAWEWPPDPVRYDWCKFDSQGECAYCKVKKTGKMLKVFPEYPVFCDWSNHPKVKEKY